MSEFTPAMDKKLRAFVEQYRQLCVGALTQLDHEYKLNKKCLPYSQETLENLLFFIPALVDDGDISRAAGKRVAKLIWGQLNAKSKQMARLMGSDHFAA